MYYNHSLFFPDSGPVYENLRPICSEWMIKDDFQSLISNCHVWTVHALANVNICLQMSAYIVYFNHVWQDISMRLSSKSIFRKFVHLVLGVYYYLKHTFALSCWVWPFCYIRFMRWKHFQPVSLQRRWILLQSSCASHRDILTKLRGLMTVG